jgi:alkylated DNA repair dioxygenase AlkB
MEPDIRYSQLVDLDETFESLQSCIAFEQRSVRVYGVTHLQPRLTRWYGPVPYTYSGLTWEAEAFPEPVERLRRRVEAETGGRFNAVLCNLYRNGQDTVGWHSDDEPLFGPDPEVASLSFGWARDFQMRHKRTGERRSYLLGEGHLLYMGRGVQRDWQHQIARRARVDTARINLTFRYAIP